MPFRRGLVIGVVLGVAGGLVALGFWLSVPVGIAVAVLVVVGALFLWIRYDDRIVLLSGLHAPPRPE